MNFKKYRFTILLGLMLHINTFAQQDILYEQNFNQLSAGQYDEEAIEEALGVKFCNGADEGRVHISDFENHGKVLDVTYPKGQVKTGQSGMHTKVPFDIGGEYDALYISYWIYFPEDFEFRAGGKLPGLAYQTSERNMSLRLMWRYDGLIEFYVHYNTEPTWDGWHASINWSLTDPYNEPNGQPQADQVKFKKGQWNHVEMYNKLNTPGQNDGIMRGWLNGNLAINITDNGDYRQEDEGDIQLNIIYLSTFFGGSDETFQPTKDVEAYFDDFKVSKNRIGDSAGNGGDENIAPMVALTSPATNNETYTLGETIILQANASDADGSIEKVNFKIDGAYYQSDPSSPYSVTWTPSETGTYIITAIASEKDQEGLSGEASRTILIINDDGDTTGGSCTFDTPIAINIPSIDRISYTNVYVLGNDGPGMDNFKKITINWNVANNGLYQFAINTNDGIPDYYVALKNKVSHTLGQSNPSITISNSGISGLDGSYWVTKDEDNFVMVSKTKEFTLYFSNSNQAPCANKVQPDTNKLDLFSFYPNPIKNTVVMHGLDIAVREIVMYDINSHKVTSIKPNKETSVSIDVTSLSKGLYFIELRSSQKETKRYKIIKN